MQEGSVLTTVPAATFKDAFQVESDVLEICVIQKPRGQTMSGHKRSEKDKNSLWNTPLGRV